MKIERFTQLNNIERFGKIIFLNFMELQNQSNIARIPFSVQQCTLLAW